MIFVTLKFFSCKGYSQDMPTVDVKRDLLFKAIGKEYSKYYRFQCNARGKIFEQVEVKYKGK